MELVTATDQTICDRCKKLTSVLYLSMKFNKAQYVCEKCILLSYHGKFPKGKSSYLPCKLCEPPNIKWYEEELYGDTCTDCGDHNEN